MSQIPPFNSPESTASPAPAIPPAPPVTPAYPPTPPPWAYPPRKPSIFRKILTAFFAMLFLLSVAMNAYLLVAVAALSGMGMEHKVLQKGDQNQVVAVYRVQGVINGELAEKFANFSRNVRSDPKVRAVVLHVNSPGGSISASNQVHNMVLQLKNAGKKVVVSMGGLAASGGYFISAPAEEIFAEPTTITGSIGVIASIPNIEGTMDKIGLKMVILKSTRSRGWKDQLSPYRAHEPREEKYLVEILDQFQAYFEKIVRDGRGKRLATRKDSYTTIIGAGEDARQVTVNETAPFNGKVYLAGDAMKLGLVDKIGFLDDACRRAGKLAGLNNPQVVRYEERAKFLGKLFGSKAMAIELGPKVLDEFQTPRFLMLWKGE